MKAHKGVGSIRALVGLWLIICVATPLQVFGTPQIIKAEYYFDTDPGVGNGIELIVSPGEFLLTSFDISVGGLEAGFHHLYIRVLDEEMKWSLVEGRTFYIQEPRPEELTTQIAGAEYFVDNDPGIDNGTPLIASEQGVIEENWTIPTEGLSEGFHQLCVRTKNNLSIWGLYETRTFYVQGNHGMLSASIVDAAEYYFDSDPGVGNGIALEISSVSGNIDENLFLNIDELLSGFHNLYVRTRDDLGRWSIVENRTFYIQETATGTKATSIVAAEYYIDTDPGFGNAIAIPLNEPLSLIDLPFSLDPSTLSFDTHQLYVRVKDDHGVWSAVARGEFTYENKQGQTITFSELEVYYYQDVFDLNASSSSALAIEYSSSDESIATINGSTVTAVGVGNVLITAIQNGNDSFIKAIPVSRDLTVSKALLIAKADDQLKKYGDDNPSLTISYEGFRNQETASVLDEQLLTTVEATSESAVGDYEIFLTSITDNHYEVASYPGVLTIEKATLEVIADSHVKTYGSTNPELTFYYSGFVNGEGQEVLDDIPTVNTTANELTEVGNVSIDVSVSLDNNYLLEAVDGTLTIEKALLIVLPNNISTVYGDVLPPLTRTIAGFVNSEDESVIDVLPVLSVPIVEAGTQEIVAMDGQDNNYDFQYERGLIEIAKAQLYVTADDKERTYGDFNTDLTWSYDGFVNGENESVLDEWPEISTLVDEFSNVGEYEIVTENGNDGNYFFNHIPGTMTVNKASLIVTADDHTITEGDQIPALTMSYQGFKNNDTEGVITAPIGTTTADSNSEEGTYEIVLVGGDARNYELTLVNGTLRIEAALGLIASEMEIYPNPITERFSIKSNERIDRVDIFTLDGRRVKSFDGLSETHDISDLPNQVYFVQLIKSSSTSFIRIVKQ